MRPEQLLAKWSVLRLGVTEVRTQLIQHPYTPPGGFQSPQVPVYRASTVLFENVAAMRSMQWKDKSGYTYGLHGTPASFLLEEKLATLEGGIHCSLLPSGLAAIASATYALLQTGDEVLLPDNVYGPNKSLAEGPLRAMGVTHQLYNAMDPSDLAAKITSRTRLVWIEAAGSVTMEFPDVVALTRICQRAGVFSALDNTWGAGLAFAPFDLLPGSGESLGVDLTVHALTKYPSGGGDVLMGSVVTRRDDIGMKLKDNHMHFGWGVGGNDVELVLRSLMTMPLRYAAHDGAARQLALWISTRPEIAQVLHPALPGAPGHAQWRSLCGAGVGAADQVPLGRAAGLFSVVFQPGYTQVQVDAFCDALQLFGLGYSWGGPESLAVPYQLPSMRPQTQGQWPAHLARGCLVRFQVGLEDIRDLQADLELAFTGLSTSI
jgi:cystathionine beta-lyase